VLLRPFLGAGNAPQEMTTKQKDYFLKPVKFTINKFKRKTITYLQVIRLDVNDFVQVVSNKEND
jgi:hypothetical protein